MYSFWSLEHCCECFCLRQRCVQISTEYHSVYKHTARVDSGRVQGGGGDVRPDKAPSSLPSKLKGGLPVEKTCRQGDKVPSIVLF